MIINNLHTAISCNRTPEAADWGRNGLIAFGACNSVSIFDPQYKESCKITHTLIGHSARVNTVKWIHNNEGIENEIISGSDDSTCILWNVQDIDNPTQIILKSHTSGVAAVDALYQKSILTIVTASADSTVKIWIRNTDSEEIILLQNLSFDTGFCFTLKLKVLPGSDNVLLALATDDDKVHLYCDSFGEGGRIFVKKNSLIGHEDWVRGLDIIEDNGDILIASSSQDTFIRLWRISPRTENSKISKSFVELNIDEEIQMEETRFSVTSKNGKTKSYAVSLESVLQGHDGWVYAVNWNKTVNGLQLLSSSIDKTLIIWSPDETGIWFENVRVGEVGGNTLGFFGAKFAENGKSIMGHGYQGSFHIWIKSRDNSWSPGVVVGGHFGEVRDICWEPEGQFLFSVSVDQTSRIHAPWVREGKEETWHELARPQVHGYDMQCIAVLSRYKFASAAEEKIIRTFEAPGNFVENLRSICKIVPDVESDRILKSTPKGASVPSLGLSNKGVYETEERSSEKTHVKDEYPEHYFVSTLFTVPPTEETLMQNTLWPENQKLYGHGYEIYSICVSPDGNLLASCCKATSLEHASVILWNTTNWKQIQKLISHQLTVTQMKFSPDNKKLLTVSRDRRLSVFERQDLENVTFELVAATDKRNGIHSRIIWTCDWSHDSDVFATGSRDGKVVAWNKGVLNSNTSLGYYKSLNNLELKGESVTAVAFSTRHWSNENGNYLVAVGLESGIIHLCSFSGTWKILQTLEKSIGHHLTVKRLIFRPNKKKLQLASCGEDSLVRIYEINTI